MSQQGRQQPRLCASCWERPATKRWVGDGGAMALVHGAYQEWCEVCVLTKQIEHAMERVAALPGLQLRLQELRDAEAAPD